MPIIIFENQTNSAEKSGASESASGEEETWVQILVEAVIFLSQKKTTKF